ncbi:MAG: iduronate-2-sulfatase [Phycisphaerae bacterium]
MAEWRQLAGVLVILLAIRVGIAPAESAQHPKLNVLFLAVDDLRPQTGCYEDSMAKTPGIDRLAERGLIFNRAYCQQAVCSPSRTSLLTGLRPDTTGVYDLATHFRKTRPGAVTLPELFKKHGYHTQGLSKIYHGGLDDPQSWTVPHWTPTASTYRRPESIAIVEESRRQMEASGTLKRRTVLERDPKTGVPLKLSGYKTPRGPAWEDPDVPDNSLADGQTADRAIEVMRQLKDRPFFLAVGFLKPHLPFVAPKKYFDLYPPEKIRLPDNPQPPTDVPPFALTTWGELRAYHGIPRSGPLSGQAARELIRAYYAATSYTDAQIGRVLDELDRLGLRDRTVVVLWGDHGWHLGEHGLWCKHTNFELATRAPLIISAPGRRASGVKTNALVEFVDIYPTLAELCGLPVPQELEGTSLVPLLDSPDRPWKTAAFSQFPRGEVMGYSMRTDRYRYTEWRRRSDGQTQAAELYDHREDSAENVNLAGKSEHDDVLRDLSRKLRAGWREARVLPNVTKD